MLRWTARRPQTTTKWLKKAMKDYIKAVKRRQKYANMTTKTAKDDEKTTNKTTKRRCKKNNNKKGQNDIKKSDKKTLERMKKDD